MHLNDHSLRQIDTDTLDRLEEEALRGLSRKLLEDLKHAIALGKGENPYCFNCTPTPSTPLPLEERPV